ncbi:non-classical arabinogalactan protein 30 [Beta vulgaris subsp. vulgaris]|uniref:non-classical arabinogalactan protein 30 n=1 Tax=Beta vulgaris subsp. vulgaris TaxID=3555 RepID=UPI00203728ED|nr:non-classical arabinogalactan protein 30 [Beta vulgaris subsp. vulgaris]
MTRTQNLFLLSVLVLALAFSYANADGYETKTKSYPKPYAPTTKVTDVVVEGIVYCQSCKYAGAWSLDEAKPIAGAHISVICRNQKDRISYYKAYTTNGDGYFYAKLQGFSMKHQLLDHPLQACVVKLVSSPIDSCDVFTNINYGVNGAKLRYENKKIMTKNYEAVIYAAGPLAFRPDHCIPNQY